MRVDKYGLKEAKSLMGDHLKTLSDTFINEEFQVEKDSQ